MNLPYDQLRFVEPAPWLKEAARLSAGGLLLPDVAAALSQLGYSDMAVAFATAALRSDAVRAARQFGEAARPPRDALARRSDHAPRGVAPRLARLRIG